MITKNPASHSLLVRPACDLDALAAEHYRQCLRPLLAEGYLYVIFDFEGTEYITSAGLGLLVEIHNRVCRNDGSLRLINCSSQVRWLLRQTKLDTILDSTEQPAAGGDQLPFDSLHALMSQEILFCARINEVATKSLQSSDPNEIANMILKGIIEACGVERGVLYFIDEDENCLKLSAAVGVDRDILSKALAASLGDNPAPQAILSKGEIQFINPVSDTGGGAIIGLLRTLKFSRSAVVPIAGVERRFGVIMLEDGKNASQPIDSQRPLMRMFSSICGLAFEKTHLLGQLKSQNEDLQQTLVSVQKFQSTLVDVGKLAALGAVVSGLGHLMNNKLVPIIGYTQMLTDGEALPEKARRQLQVVSAAAVELKNIMEKLIKVSKVREISHDLVDVNEIIAKTITLLGFQIEQSDVRMRLCLAEDLPMIIADHDLLLQGFLTAIHRACTSFPEDQEDKWILVVTSNQGSVIEIKIEDNGKGLGEMSPEDWLDPLVPFTELTEGKLFNYSIPRSVVKRHRGTIDLREKPEGGTVVEIRLPITRADTPLQIAASLEERSAHVA